MSVYKSIIAGLEESVQIEKGNLGARRQKVSVASVEEFSETEIKALRQTLHLTQVAFAQLIGMLKEDPLIPEKYHLISR